MIDAADRGQLTLTAATPPGFTRLVAVPSQLVWLDVVRAVTQRD